MTSDRPPEQANGRPVMSARELELRAEIDQLRLEKQQRVAATENADPPDRLLRPMRRTWRAIWERYYIARWHLLRARDQRHSWTPAAPAAYAVRSLAAPTAQRRRILHVVGNFHTGGSARLIVDLIEHLGHRFDQRVLVRSLPPTPAYTGLDLIHRPRLWSAAQVSALVRRLEPDLVHVHMLGHQQDEYGRRDWSWYHKVMVALERSGIPVIENINIPVEPYISPAVRVYVHVSDFVRQRFGRLDAWNETIYPGSDFELFARSGDSRVPDDCVGMVYRLQPDKLDETSLDPFIRVVQRRPQTKALIVGGGQFLEPYKRRVAQAGLTDAFTFTGYVPYGEVPALLAKMSLFVAPVHTESFGQVSPFAMGMALPVVGYQVGALEEITGAPELLAPAGDVDRLADIIVELLADRPRRLAVGERNRRRAEERFSVQSMVAQYESLYEEVLRTPRRMTLSADPSSRGRHVSGSLNAPRVTVLMAVFNGERYVREAIESILGQTFGDFELLIVNDGSTDGTPAILDSYQDPRVRVIHNEHNLGLSRSLNKGFAHARGRYIARMDADDISERDRLEQQVAFLMRHPEVVVVGSWYRIVDHDGRQVGQRWVPCTDVEIRWTLEFCSPFAHSAVMIPRHVLAGEVGPYDESLVYAMDYDLWTRLAVRGRLANLDRFLVRWRLAPGSLTSRFGDRTERFDRVLVAIRERLEWPIDEAVKNERIAALLCAIVSGATPDVSIKDVTSAIAMLFELQDDFCTRLRLDSESTAHLRAAVQRETARMILWMGHRYPDSRDYRHAVRALAAAVRQRPASLGTPEGLSLAVKVAGGRFMVSTFRRLTGRTLTPG